MIHPGCRSKFPRAALLALTWLSSGCTATAPSASDFAEFTSEIPLPTAGGTEFWSDLYFLQDWRIQRRASSTQCRLLDGLEWQHASGTYAECLARLQQIQSAGHLQPQQGKAVVLVHGLMAPRWTMHPLGEYLS